MQISVDYTVALNVLITCSLFKNEKITANYIVQKTGSDGTTVREVMYKLKKAGFITNKPGPGGTKLTRDLHDVTLLDVYNAVSNHKDNIIKFYDSPKSDPVFSYAIRETIDDHFNKYRDLLHKEMSKTSVSQLCDAISKNYNYTKERS